MKRIRIAQIGTSQNSHGREIFMGFAALTDIFEVVGYALPENEREKFPSRVDVFENYREMSVEEILSDPTIEAVSVETEEIYLTKYAQMAADAGKHVYMEKPGGVSLEAFERMIETFKQTGKVFHTGYMYRYNPVVREFLERTRAGEIGEVISVEAQMNCRHGEDVVRWLSVFPGGMMFFLGCHMIDLAVQFMGFPERVVPFNKSSGRVDDCDSKDLGMAVLEYEKGVAIVKTCDAEFGGFLRRQLVITGTKGRFMIEPLEVSVSYPLQYTKYNECAIASWNTEVEWKRSPDHDRYTDMLTAFGRMVRGEIENPYTYDYELELFRTITKACGGK